MTIGSYRNIAICRWCGQASGPPVSTLRGIIDDLLGRQTTVLYSFIHTIRDKVKLPDAAGRRGMIDMMLRYEARTACAAVIIEGSGFWASAMRNAVIGLRVVVPRTFEYRLHGDPREVLEWLPEAHQKRTGIEVSASVLDGLLREALQWPPATHGAPDRLSPLDR